MKRLVTDNPKDNIETSLNLFYGKDGWTWVRGGGPAPDYADISLCDFVRMLVKTNIPDATLPENDDDLSDLMCDWLIYDPDSAEGIISLLYTAGWAFAELRHRLAAYEDTGLDPLEIETLKTGTCLGCSVPELKEGQALHKEWEEAYQQGRLVVLPCAPGVTLVDHSDPERPELLKNFRLAVAYDHNGIVFYQPLSVFLENVQRGYITQVSEEAERALEGGTGNGT